jgi:predicted transcriptional regulator
MDKFDTRINQMKADIDEINKEIEQLKKVINILNNKI